MSAMMRMRSPSTFPSRVAASSPWPIRSRPCTVARNASERSSIHLIGIPSRFDSAAATYSSP